MSQNEIRSANFTSDTWKIYIDTVAKDKENVEDIVVETMAKLLRRQIIVYSRSYPNDISRKKFYEDANGTPLLLGKNHHNRIGGVMVNVLTSSVVVLGVEPLSG
jgi:hypothetical protein